MRPGPTARIVPSWGFSLAVSGRTMPLFVISSRGVGWITTRSPSGRSFVVEAVAVANVHSSWDDGVAVVASRWFGAREIGCADGPVRCGERRDWAPNRPQGGPSSDGLWPLSGPVSGVASTLDVRVLIL